MWTPVKAVVPLRHTGGHFGPEPKGWDVEPRKCWATSAGGKCPGKGELPRGGTAHVHCQLSARVPGVLRSHAAAPAVVGCDY